MALPKQIQAQLDAAEALQAKLAEGQAQVVEAPTEQPAEPAPQAQEPEVQAAPTVVETPPQEPAQDAAYWESRFKTVQGKLNTELPQLYQQLRERDTMLQQMQSRLESLEKQPEPEPRTAVSDKDVEEFGGDLVEMVQRVARTENQQLFAAVMAEVRKELSQVKGKVQEVEAETFWDKVRKLVPDWETVDNDPRWAEFLNTAPEFSEDTYRAMAARAIQAGKADKIAKLVETWRGKAPTTPDPAVVQANNELQRQVAPPKNAGAASSVTPVQFYTGADYQYWNDPRRIGDTEIATLTHWQGEMEKALSENRIRW